MSGTRHWQLIPRKIGLCLLASGLLCECLPAIAGDCLGPVVLLNAFDGNSDILRDLRPQDIRVEIDRKDVPILSLAPDAHPRRIVLMVDASGSMGGSNVSWRGTTLPAATYAVDLIPANASSALVTFSDKLRRESNDFEDRKAVEARVLDLAKRHPKGRTSLFDSLDQVLLDFPELHLGDAIYIVTDGGDNESKISPPKLEEKLISSGIRVFVFLVVRGGIRATEERRGEVDMYGFADSTGGQAVRISSFGEGDWARLKQLAPQIIAQVAGVYRLELGIPPTAKAARVKVKFIDRARAKNVGAILYSRKIETCSRNP